MAERKTACGVAVLIGAWFALNGGGAVAQQFQGPYIALGAGWPVARHETVAIPGLGSGKLASTNALAGDFSAGYNFAYGLRGEVEGNFRHDLIPYASGLPAGSQLRASQRQFGVFANGYYDLNLGTPYVTPFVGTGIGVEWQHWGDISWVRGSQNVYGGDSDGSGLAYQVIAGLSFPIRPVSGLSLTAEYRYVEHSGAMPVIARIDATTGGQSDQQVMLGLRYAFGNTVPAPPVQAESYDSRYSDSAILPGTSSTAASVTPPAPTVRCYIVYFDSGSAALTDVARAIIAQAAASAATGVTQVTVSGHTGSAGNAAYNLALSRHRAAVVKDELIRLGVPRDEIGLNADEGTNLAEAAGLPKAPDRRVEIMLD